MSFIIGFFSGMLVSWILLQTDLASKLWRWIKSHMGGE